LRLDPVGNGTSSPGQSITHGRRYRQLSDGPEIISPPRLATRPGPDAKGGFQMTTPCASTLRIRSAAPADEESRVCR
jgi:hypothetical protein